MKLQDHTTYLDAWGHEVRICGQTKDYPDWVWSLRGDWYERETGRRLSYRIVRDDRGRDIGGEHYVVGDSYGGNIVSLANRKGVA
jgi:hypothetical protein